MAKIKAISNHIIFQFEDEMTKHMGVRQFKDTTDWGFEIAISDESVQKPRWGKVIAIGPKCDKHIKPGSRILIDALKWTNDIQVDGESYWRTDSDNVLLYD